MDQQQINKVAEALEAPNKSQAVSIEIQAGKYYMRRDGVEVGPVFLRTGTPLFYGYKLGPITHVVNREGRTTLGQTSNDLVAEVTPLVMEVGRYYRTRGGQVAGPLEINYGEDYHQYPFKIDDELSGCTTYTAKGRVLSHITNLADEDLVEWLPGHEVFGKGTGGTPPKRELKVSKQKDVQAKGPPPGLAQRRRRYLGVVKQDQPPWEDIAIYESGTVLIPLAHVTHIEKQAVKDQPDRAGVWAVTESSRWDFENEAWINCPFVCAAEREGFLAQYKAYIKQRDNPQAALDTDSLNLLKTLDQATKQVTIMPYSDEDIVPWDDDENDSPF